MASQEVRGMNLALRLLYAVQYVGLPVGVVVVGSFVEAVGWQTQLKWVAQGEMRAASDKK